MKNMSFKEKIIVIALIYGLVIIVGIFSLVDRSSITFGDIGIWIGSIGTLLAIYFLAINTNRQIENQNKQMHRPFLDIKVSETNQENNLDNACYLCLTTTTAEDEDKEKSQVYSQNRFYDFKIKNIGSGPAVNIYFYDCCLKKFMPKIESREYVAKAPLIKSRMSPNRIGCGAKTTETIDLHYRCDKKEDWGYDTAIIIIFYSDINGNIYITMMAISLEFEDGILIAEEYYEYYEESIKFSKMVEKRGLRISEIKKEYIEKLWNADTFTKKP